MFLGHIPPELGNLGALKELSLSRNGLTGELLSKPSCFNFTMNRWIGLRATTKSSLWRYFARLHVAGESLPLALEA